MADMASVSMVIRGRVQGVGFRFFTMRKADSLDIKGYVRNLPDEEAVAVVAEGTRANLEELIILVEKGPPMARVDSVETDWSVHTGHYTDFTGRR